MKQEGKLNKFLIKLKKFLKQLLNWKFALCFGIAWMITNGWCYLFILFGKLFHIKWMLITGTSYLAFLWMPFTPEKLVTIPIALGLMKWWFPSDHKMQEDLKKELDKEKKNGKK